VGDRPRAPRVPVPRPRVPPDATERETAYRQIAEGLDGRPITLRTLDVGGDKPLSYLPSAAEANRSSASAASGSLWPTPPRAVPMIKETIRQVDLHRASSLAAATLDAADAAGVHALLADQ
jgi:phosphoenolpyruvate-protein kinase (PTS system EI component)